MTEKCEEDNCRVYIWALFILNLKAELEAQKFGHKRSKLLHMTANRYLQEIIQTQFSEFVLQMHTEVHVLYRMDHNVDELHAGHLVYEQKHEMGPNHKNTTN